MIRSAALACALLALPGALLGAPPVDVPAEVRGEPGAFVTVRAKTDGVTVRFVALDPGLNVFPSELLTDRKATVVSATRPGRYRVLAYSSVKDDPTDPAIVTVVIGDAPPPIPPGPGPSPEPGPGPAPVKVDSVFVVVVEDASAARTVETAKALNDPFWAALRPKHDYRHYLSDAPVAVSNGYTSAAKDVGYPAVLLLNAKDGEVLRKLKLTTAAEVDAAVKAVSK